MATRRLAAGLLGVTVLFAATEVEASQDQDAAHVETPGAREVPRVRSGEPSLSMLIQQATDRSPTFRRLVEAIQATDGLVYVQPGRCGHYVKACLVFWMGVSDTNRILRVIVEHGKTDVEAMASTAHELRHALEVLEQPSVRSGSDMYFFYRFGRSIKGETFETQAAIDAGIAVSKELKRWPGKVK